MGLDVNLYAVGSAVSDERVAEINDLFLRRCRVADQYEVDGVVKWHAVERDADEGRVVVNTTCHYYGPGYERGDWPGIYGAIRLLQAALPGATVYYTHDGVDDGVECSEEYLAEIWGHFLGPNGNAYHERFDA